MSERLECSMEECRWTEHGKDRRGLKMEEQVRETAVHVTRKEHRSVINVSQATVAGLVTQTCESRGEGR